MRRNVWVVLLALAVLLGLAAPAGAWDENQPLRPHSANNL